MSFKRIKYFTIPNILTLMNISAGMMSIIYAFENPTNLRYSAYLIAFAMVFDFLDGLAARLLNAKSAIGKELDSLADLVSFGVAPAVIVFQLLKSALKIDHLTLNIPITDILILLSPIIYVMAAALRLAKFNIDTRQGNNFLGLPTPAAAAFFISLPLVKDFNPDDLLVLSVMLDIDLPIAVIFMILGLQVFVMEKFYFYLPLIIIFSVLVLIELPMFSLKFTKTGGRRSRTPIIFLSLSAFLFILMQWFAIPLIIVLYVLSAVVQDVVHFSRDNNLIRNDDDEPQFLAKF